MCTLELLMRDIPDYWSVTYVRVELREFVLFLPVEFTMPYEYRMN